MTYCTLPYLIAWVTHTKLKIRTRPCMDTVTEQRTHNYPLKNRYASDMNAYDNWQRMSAPPSV